MDAGKCIVIAHLFESVSDFQAAYSNACICNKYIEIMIFWHGLVLLINDKIG